MDNRLESAGNRLEVALDQYLEASTTIQRARNGDSENIFPDPQAQSLVLMEQIPELIALERKFQRAKAMVGAARNHSTLIVPIHRLSPKLLARIFYDVVSSETCGLERDHNEKLRKYSIYLSHVCTHWRQIAISSSDLWSHIDISPSILKSERLLCRTRNFLLRANQSPLDLHIEYMTEDDGENSGLNNFIAPLVPRIRGVMCRIQLLSWSVPVLNFSQSALSSFLNKNSIPGKLTMFDVSVHGTSRTFFIQTTEQEPKIDTLSLDLSTDYLEELLLPITVLRLSIIYPQWTSKAFHGLVELRLQTTDRYLTIDEPDLIGILAHSPRLRVFEFGILVKCAATPLAPVALHDLEVLITHVSTYSHLGRLLRLLDTSSSPLFLSVDPPFGDDEVNDNLIHFFSHANITRLCTAHFSRLYKSLELANLAHTVKKLAMNPLPINPDALHEPGLPVRVHLDTLYLIGSMSMDINQLRRVIDWSGVQKLVIWGDVYRAVPNEGGKPIVSKQFLREQLSELGVDVEILPTNVSSPMDSFLL